MPVLLFHHLKGLARRAPAPLLAADSLVVGWIAGLSFGLPLLMLTAMTVGDAVGIGVGKGTLSEVLRIAVMVVFILGLTACLWSLYLLVRYALAFRKSARQARDVWAANDLAENGGFSADNRPPTP